MAAYSFIFAASPRFIYLFPHQGQRLGSPVFALRAHQKPTKQIRQVSQTSFPRFGVGASLNRRSPLCLSSTRSSFIFNASFMGEIDVCLYETNHGRRSRD